MAFLLRFREGMGAVYDRDHAAVWPEMLYPLKRSEISEYSIFRRDELLFFYMHIEGDFDAMWEKIDQDPVNRRWQQAMRAYFLSDHGARDGERFPMMKEVFLPALAHQQTRTNGISSRRANLSSFPD